MPIEEVIRRGYEMNTAITATRGNGRVKSGLINDDAMWLV
jgi:hypothetical protein